MRAFTAIFEEDCERNVVKVGFATEADPTVDDPEFHRRNQSFFLTLPAGPGLTSK